MRIVCISDTHLRHNFSVPEGDVLVHAGDGTGSGSWKEVAKWLGWVSFQPHPHKLVVAGNHDFMFEQLPELVPGLMPQGVTYLQDSGIDIDGVRFWGSPWQPAFNDWAFNLPRGQALAERWSHIPDDTEVLVTHGPPFGILDQLPGTPGDHVGCEDLLERVWHLPCLRLHVFGHIHHSYGQMERNGVRFVNACICNEQYLACRAPIVVDL